ncbi:MAG: hypothetical protein ACJAWL_001701 [Motiliproteus sp.]|jgi:hypothetical protein
MALILNNYNIIRISKGSNIINCTILKMCYDYAVVKFEGSKYKVPYSYMHKVVGHELLVPAD